jgi:hypothetical protein
MAQWGRSALTQTNGSKVVEDLLQSSLAAQAHHKGYEHGGGPCWRWEVVGKALTGGGRKSPAVLCGGRWRSGPMITIPRAKEAQGSKD